MHHLIKTEGVLETYPLLLKLPMACGRRLYKTLTKMVAYPQD